MWLRELSRRNDKHQNERPVTHPPTSPLVSSTTPSPKCSQAMRMIPKLWCVKKYDETIEIISSCFVQYKVYREATMKEIECLNELRENNQKKRLDSLSTYCICDKPFSEVMLHCDLCNECYHRTLISVNLWCNRSSVSAKVIVCPTMALM